MTDPTGHSFLSYSHRNATAARRLIEAQHEVGIPTWRDLEDLPLGPIPENLRKELQSPSTANAILWITQESLRSDWILHIELQELAARVMREDGFFLLPVAAGLPRQDAIDGLREHFGLRDPAAFIIEESPKAVPTAREAQRIARRVLDQRLRVIDAQRPREELPHLQLLTWPGARAEQGAALVLDWRHRFGAGDARLARPGAWAKFLLPALLSLRDALGRRGGHRRIQAGGQCAITAAAALGVTFLSLSPFKLSWLQPGNPPLPFSLDEEGAPVPLTVRTEEGLPGATDLAVLLSVAQPAQPGFQASRGILPAFRAIVEVSACGSAGSFRVTKPGEATTIASRTIEAVRVAHARFRPQTIHWFTAVPVGLAMLLGQSLNTLPPSQFYEYLEEGRYAPSAVLSAGR